MATLFEVIWQIKGKVLGTAGFEVPGGKAVAAATTLTLDDSRMVGADTTTAGFTLTLPLSPPNGAEYTIYDSAASGSWNTNNLIISGNGKSIVVSGAAPAATVTQSTRSGAITLRYNSTSDRWHSLSKN